MPFFLVFAPSYRLLWTIQFSSALFARQRLFIVFSLKFYAGNWRAGGQNWSPWDSPSAVCLFSSIVGSYLSLQSRTLTEQFFEGYRDAVVDGKASTAISVRFCFYSSAVFSCLFDRMELWRGASLKRHVGNLSILKYSWSLSWKFIGT